MHAEEGEEAEGGPEGKALSLETPGALPPAQMCVDDPPARAAARQDADGAAPQEENPSADAAPSPGEEGSCLSLSAKLKARDG